MNKHKLLIVAVVIVLAAVTGARSHCQIPCGIYDDPARIQMMREEVLTIEKSMHEINTLSAAGDKNYNQLVRWINNKEKHADGLQVIATQYFMFQRIKPADSTDAAATADYLNKLSLLHRITVEAMKAKQTVDTTHVVNLRSLITDFEKAYMR